MTMINGAARRCSGCAKATSGSRQTPTPAKRSFGACAARKTDFEQEPFAIILGCSDSRVPVEIVFDQELGDLFVIRVAGNIVAPSQVGSVEFAAEQFGTRLVVVLGHSHCGAVVGTLDAAAPAQGSGLAAHPLHRRPDRAGGGRPARPELGHDRETLVRRRRAGKRASVGESAAPWIEDPGAADRDDGLLVVGAEYSLETGRVDFFEEA